jgi:hypothetical protein
MADTRPDLAPLSRFLDRLSARALALADWLNAHRVAMALVAAPAVLLGIVGINQAILSNFPNSGDEYVYLYQGQTMAAGRLWNPAPSPPAIFQLNYIVQEPGRAFGSFPFGWPLMLALALRLGLPAWLVNPLLGTITLGILWWLGARLYSPRVGVLAAALVGVSPFFSSMLLVRSAHACGALLLGAAFVAARHDRSPAWVPLVAGLLVGWAVVTRYFTGAVCAVPIALLLLRPGVPRWRTLSLFVLGGLPWAALLGYNSRSRAARGGSRSPPDGFLWFGRLPVRGRHSLTAPAPPSALDRRCSSSPTWCTVGRAAQTRRGAIDWILVLTAVTLYFYVERGGNQQAAVHYEAFLFLVLFVAANVFEVARSRTSRAAPRALRGWPPAGRHPLSFVVHVH